MNSRSGDSNRRYAILQKTGRLHLPKNRCDLREEGLHRLRLCKFLTRDRENNQSDCIRDCPFVLKYSRESELGRERQRRFQ